MRLDDNRSPVDSGGSTADSFNSDLAYHSEEDNNPRDHRMGSASPGNEMIAGKYLKAYGDLTKL